MIFDPHIYILEQNFLSSYTDWIHTQIFHASNNSNILNIYLNNITFYRKPRKQKKNILTFFCVFILQLLFMENLFRTKFDFHSSLSEEWLPCF